MYLSRGCLISFLGLLVALAATLSASAIRLTRNDIPVAQAVRVAQPVGDEREVDEERSDDINVDEWVFVEHDADYPGEDQADSNDSVPEDPSSMKNRALSVASTVLTSSGHSIGVGLSNLKRMAGLACNPGGGWTAKKWHLEYRDDEGRASAVVLERTRRSAVLKLYEDSSWGFMPAETRADPWVLQGTEEESTINETIIDVAGDVSYIEFRPEVDGGDNETYKADQIYIALKAGRVKQLLGGVYLPEAFVRHAFKNDTEAEIASKSKLGYASTPMHGKYAGLLANTVGVAGSAVVTPVFAVVGLLAGAIGGKEKEDADRIFWAVAGKGGDWGRTIGTGAGAVAGGMLGSPAAIYRYFWLKQHLKLSAAQKLFKELRCHMSLKQCSKTILVPKDADCPEVEINDPK